MKKSVHIQKDLEEIILRLQSLNEDSKPAWGKIKVTEIIPHLTDYLRIGIGLKITKNRSSFYKSTISKWTFLWNNVMPKFLISIDEIDPEQKMTPPISLQKDIETFINLLYNFIQLPYNHIFTHSSFGKLSKTEFGQIMYLHADYHLTQFGV